MRMRIILLVFAVAGTAAIVAWRESRFAGQAIQARAALSADITRVTAALRETEMRLAAFEKERADLQAALDSLPKAPPSKTTEPAKKANPDAATALTEWARAEDERQKDPQVQLRQLEAARTKLRTLYGALYWKLKLAPEQIEQFEAIAAKREEQEQDLMAAVLAQGVSMSDADFAKLYMPLHEKIDQAFRAAEKDLLGDAGYQQFDNYERGLPARNVIRSIAGAAVLLGTPFSPEQAEQLVDILSNTSISYRQGRNLGPLEIDWTQADERARAILSNEQMTSFQTLAPSTGGTGRFWLQFNRALNEAQMADRKLPAPTKPTGEK